MCFGKTGGTIKKNILYRAGSLGRKPCRQSDAEGGTMANNCEECVHYDYDDEIEAYYCTMDLDEDERVCFVQGQTKSCPYYRFYDEYKSVQKQN